MKNKDIKKEILEIKNEIKRNSKDDKFAELLTEKLITAVKENKTHPIALDCGKEISSFDNGASVITKTSKGILFHTYGGYNIFVTPNNKALYDTLADYVNNRDTYKALDGEMKKDFDLRLSAVNYCLLAPAFCFADEALTLNIATTLIEYLRNSLEEAMKASLQEETVAEDEQFKQGAMSLDYLVEESKKEIQGK